MTNEDGTISENTIEAQAEVIFGEKYLRNRPFLVLTETSRPAPGVKTETKGWMEVDGQLKRFEQPSIVDRVQRKHLVNATIIIDLLNRAVVKNRHAELGTDEQFLEFYMEKYAEQITEGLRIWAQRSALDIGKKAAA
jgi:hypothetical protein